MDLYVYVNDRSTHGMDHTQEEHECTLSAVGVLNPLLYHHKVEQTRNVVTLCKKQKVLSGMLDQKPNVNGMSDKC